MNDGAPVFVALDQGGHATRALAFDGRGRRLAVVSEPVETLHTATGGIEHDGEALVASVGQVLARLARKVPVARWQAAGLAVQRSTVACWDRRSGELLAPVISWQDRRQARWVAAHVSQASRVHELTGLPLSPHYGACKLRWCLENISAVREAGQQGRLCAGPLASLLLARLLRQHPFACDEANASRTQLWSPQARCWSPELLALFGIPAAVLPQLRPTCGYFGDLDLHQRTVPLVACTGDQSAVPFAAGRLDMEAAYVNLGTGAFLLRPVDAAMRAAPLLTSVLFSDARQVRYAIEGTVNGAGSALHWLAGEAGLDVESLLCGLDDGAGTDAEIPLFLNGIAGIGSPYWAAEFQSRFVGAGTPLQRLRAVIESIAFLLKANFDTMAAHATRPRRIIASGGLARSEYLLSSLATLVGLPVQRLEDGEATARGLACLVAEQPAGWEPPLLTTFEPVAAPGLEQRWLRWQAALLDALGR